MCAFKWEGTYGVLRDNSQPSSQICQPYLRYIYSVNGYLPSSEFDQTVQCSHD